MLRKNYKKQANDNLELAVLNKKEAVEYREKIRQVRELCSEIFTDINKYDSRKATAKSLANDLIVDCRSGSNRFSCTAHAATSLRLTDVALCSLR